MTARRRPGPGKTVWQSADGTWACRAWNGRGQVVEVTGNSSREQAQRQADFELAGLVAGAFLWSAGSLPC